MRFSTKSNRNALTKMHTFVRYTHKELTEEPFTEEDVIATAKMLLRDRTPKGESVPLVCTNGVRFHPGPYNYPEFNDLVYVVMEESYYYQYR